jgi:DNA (cytosine-5)-methyltransferase 1
MPTFLEFFAGGGMARAGLGESWKCLFANDFDPMKANTYRINWGGSDLVCDDIAKLNTSQIPGKADLAWASFPCQDLSLAGNYAGMGSESSKSKTRSGTFWPFWGLMRTLREEGRAPKLIVLENVFGVLSSRGGKDFSEICSALSSSNYRVGAMVIDASHFVPQSRKRVFFVAVDVSLACPKNLSVSGPTPSWHPSALKRAHSQLPASARKNWIWWRLPEPPARVTALSNVIQETPSSSDWHSLDETRALLEMMSPLQRAKISAAQDKKSRAVGCLYKRTRTDELGIRRQRAEVRFDGLAGCLRTPGGGSSRQTLLIVDDQSVRSRLLTSREAARLMGLPDSYKLPLRYNEAYKLAGDGVCVSVVTYLAQHILMPILDRQTERELLIDSAA